VEYKNKDFTDYFLLFFNSDRLNEFKTAFKLLIDNAKTFEEAFPELSEIKEDDIGTDYKEIDFYDSIKEEYINKPITFTAMVRGEAAKPYIYPVKIRVNCDMTRGEMCASCGLFLTGGHIEIKLDNISPLELIDCNNVQKISLIKRKLGIMQCGQFKIEVLEQKYMQEIFLSPDMKGVDETKEQRFIVRHAFAEGSEIIPNKKYKFSGKPISLPKNQSLVFYIKKYKEEEDDLDKFKLTNQEKEDLKIFQVENTNIEQKLKEIYNDFSVNLSPIIRYRNDIMFSVDLVFHSVLHFKFGQSFEKGWTEALIVGDTSTGKTKIATKLIKHYKAGIIQGAENSTIAGLIGGMTKFESINVMTWGLLPLNNSRAVVLDEMSGIDREVFSELTRIRSEGIAERTIVGGSSSTSAKVRLLWISNPRKRAIRLYDNGCDMVKELIGNEEDISRFDFILTISENEVNPDKINAARTKDGIPGIKHVYTGDLCNKLILWGWSRKANNVIFDKDVEDLILFYSVEMSNKYSPNFPLVLGSTIRLKLSRLSIALAVRLFSTDDSGENVIIKTEHVEYIYNWLNKIYNKESFGYGEYSAYHKAGDDKTSNSKDEVFKLVYSYCGEEAKSFILNMINTKRITFQEIHDFARCTRDQADKLRATMVSCGFLDKKQGFYVKTAIFRKALKEELAKL